MAGECTINAPTISAQACVQASCLWDSFERQQLTLWFDNYRRYINGVDPHSPDETLNVTAVGVLHTTELPRYHGLPGLDVVAQRISGVVGQVVRCVGLLLQGVQSQMGLFCGPGFVHLRTMLAIMWYPSTAGPFCYHTSNAEVMLSYWSLSGG